MTDRLHIDIGEAQPLEPASSWRAPLRHVVGFLLLFGLALLIMRLTDPETARTYPSPLWLPVILLSLHLGLEAGIAAAIVAIGIFLWQGLPAQIWTEDIYTYAGRIGAEPIGWTGMALLTGYLRRQQIRERSELKTELAERAALCRNLAKRCDELRQRTDMLERHIAANVVTSHVEIAEAVSGLNVANSADFSERLSQFLAAMLGTPEFVLYLRKGDELRREIDSAGDYEKAVDVVISSDQPLFDAVIRSHKTLLSARQADRDLLNSRDAVVGPLMAENTPDQAIGLLRVGGSGQTEFPQDFERKFAFVQSETSRALSRIRGVNPAAVKDE